MRTHLTASLALAAAISAPASAQTPPCLAANDANNLGNNAITLYGFSGQNTFGYQITPTTAHVLQAAQVFTKNDTLSGDRYMAVEIWDDVGGLPGSRLAGGSWKIDQTRPAAWQGANLDQFAILQANVPVWVVWIEPGWSQPMVELGGTMTLPSANRSTSGSWNTGSSSQAPKFRLFCTRLDDVNSVPFGAGCALSTGFFPTVYTNYQPTIGNASFTFESSGNPPGAPVFMILGADPSFVSAPVPGFPAGCDQNTNILASVLLFAGTGDTRGPTYGGHAQLAFPIPANAVFTGVFFAAQVAPFDVGATAPLQFGTSNAHRITLY